ncbi:MAG: universal stress protein UspA [Holophagales bacterium]|nr:universal stress protein UspA [Holophagales bacterium]MYG29028.1 universal stress protein UspA [Holophagales bacterium]MYI80652.1 universal stress protein UspA [Holophagales bacterium]
MYKTIYVPVDNSDYSNQAIASAVELGRKFDSTMVGCHVYAASMHDYRFKQMEYTLPDEYLEETELDRQRKIHDSLITMGLELISESYLEPMKAVCDDAGLDFEPKMMDGKHHVEIVRDIRESGYDLTVLGVMGIGRVRDTQIGSVCERVARTADRDVLVIKRLPAKAGAANGNGNGHQAEADGRDTILVGVDGSPQSFGALMTAIDLAKTFGKKVEAISVYDPYLHYSVFKGVVNVLTERAAKIFRFEEQNQLHEEIIDTGLAQIYQSHLDVAETMATEVGVELTKTLLDGKAFQKVLDHARKIDPWMLVIGRVGVHSDDSESGLGSNAENLLRACPCDLLLTTRLEYPELDVKAEESIRWTPEAEERFKRVPEQVRGIARTALYRLAVEQGHSVISSDVLDEAMDRYMPKYTARETEALAEKVALQLARSRPTFICRKCGVTSAEPDPVRCGVCGSDSFEQITEEMLERIAEMEGGLEVETTYDGRKLKWTADARLALKTIEDAYRRRRAKARIEKKARMSKLPTVTFEFARVMIEDETGEPVTIEARVQATEANGSGAAEASADERKLIARDDDRVPLLSSFEWTAEAVERILRVPAGFMRDRTQERVELVAREKHVSRIGIKTVEEGIELGRKLMEQMIAAYEIGKDEGTPATEVAEAEAKAAQGAGRCPFSALAEAGASEAQVEAARDAKAGTYLNEVGLMSALDEKRKAGEPEA